MAKVKKSELRQKLVSFAQSVVSVPEAEYYADEVIEAHIRKAPRTNVVKSAVTDILASKKSGKEITYTVDLPSYISIDFNSHGPLTYIKKIHDELEQRAKTNGLVMAAFVNGKSMHTLHTWVQGLAKRGLVSIAVCNGGPDAVVPFNGTRGLFGTNPIAYSFPGKGSEIHCVDMATSEIPYFEILDAKKYGRRLPERAAVNDQGEFTTDPEKALDYRENQDDPVANLVSIGGGYKGYYITYLTELMTSALIGSPSSSQMSSNFVPEEHGALLMVMSPGAFGTSGTFSESVGVLNSAISGQRPKTGTTIRVPGEGNNEKLAQSGDEIEIDDSILEMMAKGL